MTAEREAERPAGEDLDAEIRCFVREVSAAWASHPSLTDVSAPEARNIAESTMCAVIGRMSAYTGRALKWDWAMKASKLDLRPEKYEFGDLPLRPVAIPGKTQLI